MKYCSLLLVAVCVAVFAVQLSVTGFTDDFLLSDAAARPYVLITSIFLHGSLSHLFFNMFALALFGLILERDLGSRKFLFVFLLSGVIANVAASFFYSSSLGASGAISGIIGTLAVLRPRMIVWTYGVPMPMIAAAVLYLLLDLGGIFFPSDIANAAHITGLLTGVVIGLMLHKPQSKEEKEEKLLTKDQLDHWEDEWMT